MGIPILFIAFNRPEETRTTLTKILSNNPARLYVYVDGPRPGNKQDEINQEKVVHVIKELCSGYENIQIHIRTKNLGCKKSVSSAIYDFFKHETKGAIIEDDCLVSNSFFKYCSLLLDKYETDKRILSINGCNFGFREKPVNSYGFCSTMNMWGWATWRDRVELVDYNLSEWRRKSTLRKLMFLWKAFPNCTKYDLLWIRYWLLTFNKTLSLDTWDYQWVYCGWRNRMLSVFPYSNLVSNIGFSERATHTSNSTHYLGNLETEELEGEITHNTSVELNVAYESNYIRGVYVYHDSLLPRVKRRLKSILRL